MAAGRSRNGWRRCIRLDEDAVGQLACLVFSVVLPGTIPFVESPPITLVEAAVLVPVFRREDGALRILLVRRSEHGVHGGQLGFPGGKREPADHSLLDTALREAAEEIGVPREAVEILQALPGVETLTTGYRISPFLARIVPPRTWQNVSEEIAEVIEVAAQDLARPEVHVEDMDDLPTWRGPRPLPFFKIGPHRLWGATYQILRPLLPRLIAGEFRV